MLINGPDKKISSVAESSCAAGRCRPGRLMAPGAARRFLIADGPFICREKRNELWRPAAEARQIQTGRKVPVF